MENGMWRERKHFEGKRKKRKEEEASLSLPSNVIGRKIWVFPRLIFVQDGEEDEFHARSIVIDPEWMRRSIAFHFRYHSILSLSFDRVQSPIKQFLKSLVNNQQQCRIDP